MDRAFEPVPIAERTLMPRLARLLETAAPFWRDSRLRFKTRTYDFERRNSSDDKPKALVMGGQLAFESGSWRNLSVGAAYYNSTEISASGPDTGLLEPGGGNLSVIGEANVRYRFTTGALEGSEVKLYRQTLNLPFINKHDIRQLPASHEAYTLYRRESDLNYVVGHIAKFKDYFSNKFVHMSEAAGADGTDKGVSVAGARYKVNDAFTVGAADYYGWDTFNTFFTEATWHHRLSDALDVRVSGQFTDQHSIGDELVGDFDTTLTAVKGALGWHGAVITLGASTVGNDAAIRKPWGGSPSYLSIQRLDFDRANEDSVLLGLSYNTGYLSSLGLSSYINIAHGANAEDPATGADLPNRTEYDLTVDYKPPGGLLLGLWVRARFNQIDIDGDGETVRDFRLIVNYTLKLY